MLLLMNLIRCFVIVDGEDLSFGAGGDCIDAFWKTGCFGAEGARVNGLLERRGSYVGTSVRNPT